MRGVVHSFLATYTSRYSDHLGYWMFGQLALGNEPMHIDLLGSPPHGESVVDAVRRCAIRSFAEQVERNGLVLRTVREATLEIAAIPKDVEGRHGGHMVRGRDFRFVVRAVMDHGRAFQDHRVVFVAPHDPAKESRRHPDNWNAWDA